MASYGHGFASGLQSGSNAARGWLSAYDWGKDKKTEEEVAKAYALNPEEISSVDPGGSVEGLVDEHDVPRKKQYKLGSTVQDTPFTEAQTDNARTRAAADTYGRLGKPERGMALRQQARQGELTEVQIKGAQLGLKGAERRDAQEDYQDRLMKLARRAGAMDDDSFYAEAAQIATHGVADGNSFGYTRGPDGQVLVGMIGKDGTLTMHPATREQVIDQLMSYASPQARDAHQKLGLERTRADATSRTAAAAERNSRTMEQYRKDQAPVLQAQAGYYRQLGNRAGAGPQLNDLQQFQLQQQREFVEQRNMVMGALNNKAITPETARKHMAMLQMKYGAPPARGEQTGPQALGSTGLIRMGDKIVRFDERTNTLVPVDTEEDLAALGAEIRDGLKKRDAKEGRGAPKEPRGLAGVLDKQRPNNRVVPDIEEDDRMMYP
jgi:hypothetical protein